MPNTLSDQTPLDLDSYSDTASCNTDATTTTTTANMMYAMTCSANQFYCGLFSVIKHFNNKFDLNKLLNLDANNIAILNGKYLYVDPVKKDIKIILSEVSKDYYIFLQGIPCSLETKYFVVNMEPIEITINDPSIKYSIHDEIERLENNTNVAIP